MPGREEQALDVVAPVEVERQPHHLLDREAGNTYWLIFHVLLGLVFYGLPFMPQRSKVSMAITNVPMNPRVLHQPLMNIGKTSMHHCRFIFRLVFHWRAECVASPATPRPTWELHAIVFDSFLGILWCSAL